MKKKKIILALLASLCVATGAAGVAGCTSGDSAATHDPALYAAYQQYADNTDNPLSYEEWLAEIIAEFEAGGEKGPQGDRGEDAATVKEVNLINVNGKEYYEFIFTSGRIIRLATDGSDKQETTCFTIKTVDQFGDPVENVYFSIGYKDGPDNYYMTESGSYVTNEAFNKVYAAKTNSSGIATFYTFPESDHDFNVYVADPASISAEGEIGGIPKGYSVNFGKDEASGMAKSNAPFTKGDDGNYSVTVNMVMENSWSALYDSSNDLQYKRYPDGTEQYTPYVKSAERNRYNYFTLEPFAQTRYDEQTYDGYAQAASGVYRVSWTTNKPDAQVQLLSFNFFYGMYFITNADGSPADSLVTSHSGNMPTDEALLRERYQRDSGGQSYEAWLAAYGEKFTGSNYVDVTIDFDNAFLTYCLAFISDMNCDVTISVERIGDVPKWTDTGIIPATMPADAKKADDRDGRIIDVPLNATIVKGDDGYYHLGNANGEIIYVQLLKGTRANSMSMLELTSYTVGEGSDATTRSAFSNYVTEEFNEETNTGVRVHTDYTGVVQGYAEFANSDGLYPVNDQIKTILETFCKSFSGWNRYDSYWAAACSYYGPVADGSENAPYDLVVGNNTVELNGTTYVAFRASATGYYGFSSTVGNVALTGDSMDVDGVKYVKISANQELVFTVTGNGTATVKVDTIASTKVIEYSYNDPNDVGTDSNPVKIIGSGVYQVNIDHNMSNGNRVTVDICPLPDAEGEYKIEIYGSSTAQVVDSNGQSLNGKTITLVDYDIYTRFWVDDVADGTFFIKITKVS